MEGLQHEDHPRVGGEKRCKKIILAMPEGSPPRGRGKENKEGEIGDLPRITPAWAGKRLYCHDCESVEEDHPRVGGEKLCPVQPC